MQNMLERIAAAEKQADQILEQANAEAKELIARTKSECADAVEAARTEEMKKTADAVEKAERDGESLADGILADVRAEIEAVTHTALKKIPDAVSYLMERIETTL